MFFDRSGFEASIDVGDGAPAGKSLPTLSNLPVLFLPRQYLKNRMNNFVLQVLIC